MLRKLAALGVLGLACYRYLRKDRARPAFAENQGLAQVRDAGPQAMRDAPGGPWTKTDEEIDESFPASDPPSNY
ncbi:hypothetical protein [Erythrobacter mangrovi]|uniref:Uncharacterized protein n=1 Tax=Erythrobacter mangrovi TaxID=2739433 RepID=A0A7D3XAR5_9SPHN|nr:hypothetical protein [Erythrobacter mangrovi]QKG70780.1 hypothetical protein HQR01_05015 [Erythrobacter mangrovi]